MKFPFVSRERYDERLADVATLRTEITFERERNQRLWNFLNWRTAGGVAFDTSLLPDAYQPRTVPTSPQPAEGAGVETIRSVRAPGQARRELAVFETRAQQEFDRVTVGARPARVTEEQAQPASEKQQAAGD